MSYTYFTYIANGKEHYVYGERDDSVRIASGIVKNGRTTLRPVPAFLLTQKKSFPFSESLMRLLDLDYFKLDEICKRIDRALLRLYRESEPRCADEVRDGLDELAREHIYFEFLRLDWRERLRKAEEKNFQRVQELLPHKRISQLPSEIDVRQKQILELLPHVLDLDKTKSGGSTALWRLSSLYADADYDPPRKKQLFQFGALPLSFERVEYGDFCETLHPQSVYDLIDYHLRENIRRDQKWRVCKNCKRYFPMTGRASAEYCDRPITASGSTCKDVGSTKTWEVKMYNEDKTFPEYRREYKRRFAWIRLGKWTKEEFTAWSVQAQQKKAACDKGEIDAAEFVSWLKNS